MQETGRNVLFFALLQFYCIKGKKVLDQNVLMLYNVIVVLMGYRQMVRQRTLTPSL